MSNPDTPVSTVMTVDPISVHPEATLDEAVTILRDHPFRHLPVATDGELVGILSDRDLLCSSRGDCAPAGSRLVREIMQADVRTVGPEVTLGEAAGILCERRIGGLPVVEGKRVLGIITETDMLIAFRDWCREIHDLPWARALVGDHMTPDPITIGFDSLLDEALHMCTESRIRHLPVMKGDQLFGILSDRDIRRGLAGIRIDDAQASEQGRSSAPAVHVSDVATRSVLVISPQSVLTAAVFTMASNKFGALPVLDAGRLAGVISQVDIMACYAAARA